MSLTGVEVETPPQLVTQALTGLARGSITSMWKPVTPGCREIRRGELEHGVATVKPIKTTLYKSSGVYFPCYSKHFAKRPYFRTQDVLVILNALIE